MRAAPVRAIASPEAVLRAVLAPPREESLPDTNSWHCALRSSQVVSAVWFSTRRWKMAMPAAGALRAKYVSQRALSAKGSSDTVTPSLSAVLTVLPPGAAGVAALEYSGRWSGVAHPQRPASASDASERDRVFIVN